MTTKRVTHTSNEAGNGKISIQLTNFSIKDFIYIVLLIVSIAGNYFPSGHKDSDEIMQQVDDMREDLMMKLNGMDIRITNMEMVQKGLNPYRDNSNVMPDTDPASKETVNK